MQSAPRGTGSLGPLRLPAYSELGNKCVLSWAGRLNAWVSPIHGPFMAPMSAVPANWAASLPIRLMSVRGQPGNRAAAAAAAAPPHRHFVLPSTPVFPSLAPKHGSSQPTCSTSLHGPVSSFILGALSSVLLFWMLLRFEKSCVIVCMHRFSRWPKRHARGSAMVRPVSCSSVPVDLCPASCARVPCALLCAVCSLASSPALLRDLGLAQSPAAPARPSSAQHEYHDAI